MHDPDAVGRYVRRLELALQDGHYDRGRRILSEAEAEFTSSPEPITLDSPLSALDLPSRVVGTLERHGVHTLGDALQLTPDDLAEIPSFGPASVRLLVATLRALSITSGD